MVTSQDEPQREPGRKARRDTQRADQRQPRSRFSDEYGVLLECLIALRKEKGVTQAEVAKRLGKTQSHVSMCENREREISIIDLWHWCESLGINLSEFCREFEESVKR